ncbi:phage shock protein A (PspA) family protein [Streptohalobacillus salinus]|uniref:Phage shock protein A (PspA) family protein n=1 Tax=Streptohalobacillus salinus TaxID=621096 RepID=A0A2V3VZX1_9BACI|nr:PspA/IM30 family protein [Streptohalobacillus salinus]PXW87180.1 phage shock protein A (PspA) family protein [Streptohalobacillus salinus]
MTNIFTRLKDTFVADINQLIDQKEEQHPMTHLNQYIRKCEDEVKKLKGLIEKQYQIQREYKKEWQKASQMADKRSQQVALAEAHDRADLKEEAQADVETYQARATQLKEMYEKTTTQIADIELKYETMQHQLKNLYVKRLDLRGRENLARVHRGINQVLNPEQLERSQVTFNDVEAYIERLEHKVYHDHRLHTLDARFAELEKNDSISH